MLYGIFLLTSLSVMIRRYIRIAANGIILFCFMAELIFHSVYLPHLPYPFIC